MPLPATLPRYPTARPAASTASASGRRSVACVLAAAAGAGVRGRRSVVTVAGIAPSGSAPDDFGGSGGGGSGGGGGFGGFNPFRNKQKEDAAKQLLQDMFKDKGDPLSMYDGGGGGDDGGGGKGKGRGGSGGGGGGNDDGVNKNSGGGNNGGEGGDGDAPGGGGGFDWRSAGSGALGKARSTGRTLAAVAIVVVGLGVLPFYKQVISLTSSLVGWLLRLDAAGPRGMAAVRAAARRLALEKDAPYYAALGQWEVEALSRYGPDQDGTDGGSVAGWRAAKAAVRGEAKRARVRVAAAAAEESGRAVAAAKVEAARRPVPEPEPEVVDDDEDEDDDY